MTPGADLARLGEFFAVDPAPSGDGWRPVEDLVTGPYLHIRVLATELSLAPRTVQPRAVQPGTVQPTTVQHRVPASIASLGLFARLLSPTVGAAALGTLAPADLHWRERPTGTLPLAAGSWAEPDLHAVLSDVVQPLAERLRVEHSVSGTVLAGNATSAVFGAVRVVTASRPELAGAALDVGRHALDHPWLRGTADLRPTFRRRSCCLYYRLPGAGTCGDCVLARRGG